MSGYSYLIKAYATNEVGLGMVSRAFCLSEELIARGLKVTVITNEPFGRKYFKNFNINIVVIEPNVSFEEELNVIRGLLDKNTVLVLTEYKNINEYFGLLNPFKIALLADEIEESSVPIDLFVSSLLLKNPTNKNIKKSLCGLEYHFIKKEILNYTKTNLEEIPKKVLLTMGGSDNKELTVALTAMLYDSLKDCRFTVLLGTCHQRVGFTEKRLLGISDDIEINRNASKVEHQYNTFDFALCKGGVTCYELMYLGVPLLSVSTSEYQKEVLQYLDAQGALIYAGHWNQISDVGMKERISEIYQDFPKRNQLSQKSRKIIDGKGIARIVEALEDL